MVTFLNVGRMDRALQVVLPTPIMTVTRWKFRTSHTRHGFPGEGGVCKTAGRIPRGGQKSIWRLLLAGIALFIVGRVESEATWRRNSPLQLEMQV